MSAYAALEARFERLGALSGASAVLGWDQAVMMPRGGARDRGRQLAALSGVSHELLTAPEVGDLLGRAESEQLDPWQRANLELMARRYKRATAIDSGIVEALSRATTECEMTWREARAASDFKALAPSLGEVLRLVRTMARATGEVLGLDPYDALIDEYQLGLSSADIDPLFAELEAALPPMIARIEAKQAPVVRPRGPFPVECQRELAHDLMRRLGFDFEHGRLDESTHPFCGGTPGDIRITTRYDEGEVVSAIMGVLHETGHALYEAGLPERWQLQPVGQARGMAVHESQSLLIEMQACRSPAFLRFLSARLAALFGNDEGFDIDNLLRAYTRVERGFIRVDADEVTYPLHIVLRYRLERALIDGDLEVADLPDAWARGMDELLGVRPPEDRLGCLQDIHWPLGGFGYFPSYTLGAVTAAQLFRAAEAALPSLQDELAQGEFASLRGWLREHVHGRASSVSMDQLIREATGKPLSAQDFLGHLAERYGG